MGILTLITDMLRNTDILSPTGQEYNNEDGEIASQSQLSYKLQALCQVSTLNTFSHVFKCCHNIEREVACHLVSTCQGHWLTHAG